MGQSTFQGPVRSLNGFYAQGPGTVVTVGSATLTLDPATHGGKILVITAATTTITLPAVNVTADPNSSGPGSDPNTLNNQGVTYTFVNTILAVAIKVLAPASNFLLGSAMVSAATPSGFFANGTSIRSINLNGTTTGGIVGSYFTITAIASGQYLVQGQLAGSGTLATPFAAS
jgi:hypothetical protein